MASQSYRDLNVWQRGIAFVERVYEVSATFPESERFGITAQLRRAAASIPANIAEGQARLHRAEFVHHLSIARGSLAEAETFIVIARRLGYLNSTLEDELGAFTTDLRRMLHGLIRSVDGSDSMHSR